MTLNTVNSLAYAATILVVAATADWRLLVLAALGAPRLLGARWSSRWGNTAEEASAPHGRLSRHLIDLITTPAGGAEVRVFSLQHRAVARVRGAVEAWRSPGVHASAQNATLSAGFSVLFFGSAVALLAWMTHDVIAAP